MKNLIVIILILTISAIHISSEAPLDFKAGSGIPDLCYWQKRRDEIIGKLTPEGQIQIKKLMLNLQSAVMTSIKPMFKLVATELSASLFKLQNSDANNFNQFLNFLTFGFDFMPFTDNGKLIDLCIFQSYGTVLMSSFKPDNQQTALNVYAKVVEKLLPTVERTSRSIESTNQDFIKQLNKTETIDNLKDLNKLGLNYFNLFKQ